MTVVVRYTSSKIINISVKFQCHIMSDTWRQNGILQHASQPLHVSSSLRLLQVSTYKKIVQILKRASEKSVN